MGKKKTSRQLHNHKGSLLWHTFRNPRESCSRDIKCAVEDVIHGDAFVSGYGAFCFFVGQSGKETYRPRECQKRSQSDEQSPDRWKFLQGVPINCEHYGINPCEQRVEHFGTYLPPSDIELAF